MDGKAFTPTDAIALQNSGYGRGYDGFGDGYGSWFWIIIILFFAWGNNSWGNRNNEVDIDTRFLERDIFNTNQNVSNTACQTQRDVLDSKYDLGTQILENRYQNQLCCCDTNRNIDSVRYDNLLTAKDAQMQLSDCCCRLEAQGISNTQKILDKLCENEITQLRTDLQSAQLQISQLSQTANITNALRPYPTPAYLTCSPYMSSIYAYNGFNNCGCGCGCNNLI